MNKRTKSSSIRIIGGRWRGRRLPVLDSPGLRPSIDRVRETLFNWLMHDIAGARCLDLFAGSGALGLEALSRGARFVQFVERDKSVAAALSANIAKLGVDDESAVCVNSDGLLFLSQQQSEQYDIVFLDPPFDTNLLQASLELLRDSECLREGAMVYIEQRAVDPVSDALEAWQLYREAKAGQTRYALYHV